MPDNYEHDSHDDLALPSSVENDQELSRVRALDSARIDAAFGMVSDLCQRRREWIMSIPARPDYDPDLVIASGLQAGRDALKRLGEVETQRNDLLEALKSIRCTDCKDGILFLDSWLFDLDREDGSQPCPNCTIRLVAIAKAQGAANPVRHEAEK